MRSTCLPVVVVVVVVVVVASLQLQLQLQLAGQKHVLCLPASLASHPLGLLPCFPASLEAGKQL